MQVPQFLTCFIKKPSSTSSSLRKAIMNTVQLAQSHSSSEQAAFNQQSPVAEVCTSNRHMRAFTRPTRLLVPGEADAVHLDVACDPASTDQPASCRMLQGSSSSCSEASFCTLHWAEQHRTTQLYPVSPAVTGLPSPASRRLFTDGVDSSGMQQHGDCWPGATGLTTPNVAAVGDVYHRRGIERWLSKMESQATHRGSGMTHAGTAATAGPFAGMAHVPKTPNADLPAPAFVLMGLLSA